MTTTYLLNPNLVQPKPKSQPPKQNFDQRKQDFVVPCLNPNNEQQNLVLGLMLSRFGLIVS